MLRNVSFCKAKIRMRDQKEGKWRPYNIDGTEHDCKSKSKNGNGKKTNSKNYEKQ
jgi:hypothetical protein